jgi:hypothetical protein
MLDSTDRIRQALDALAKRLEFSGAPSTEIAVCGGAALFLRGLMSRHVTKDVDAFGIIERKPDGTPRIVKKKPLPEYLLREAEIVAKDLGLPQDWLNEGPADIVDLGLPEGLESRLHPVVFGPKLTVHFLDRIDQIHFKLYAATDQGADSRHMADLMALKPTAEELERAARWSMTHDISEGYRMTLQGCLKFMGHADVADRI